jgi:hypothetical protein
MGPVTSRCKGFGVVRPKVITGFRDKVVVIVAGCCNLTGLAKAPSSALQQRMSAPLVQGVFGAGGQGFCIGAQGLGEGCVTFDVGPGGH